jgi:hypothetical protein
VGETGDRLLLEREVSVSVNPFLWTGETSQEIPTERLYSSAQIVVAAALANPMTAGVLLALNARALGRSMAQDLAVMGAITLAQLTVSALSSGTLGLVSVWGMGVGLTSWWVRAHHDDELVRHDQLGGERGPWWVIPLIWLATLPPLLMGVLCLRLLLG